MKKIIALFLLLIPALCRAQVTNLAHGGTNQTSWTANRCVHVNSLKTALEITSADCVVITVNGGSPLASVNLNATTPAAPANGFNTHYQESSGSVSSHLLTTDIGSTTFGGNSDITWTFNDSGASSPTVAFTVGAIDLTAAGTNKNITLTPSGTGTVVIPGAAADSIIKASIGPAAASFSSTPQTSLGSAQTTSQVLNGNGTVNTAFQAINESSTNKDSYGAAGMAYATNAAGQNKSFNLGGYFEAYAAGEGGISANDAIYAYSAASAGDAVQVAAVDASTSVTGGNGSSTYAVIAVANHSITVGTEIIGVDARANSSNLGGTSIITGIRADAYVTGTSTRSPIGGWFNANKTSNTTSASLKGINIAPNTKTTGTVTTNYGLYVDSQTVGATNYSIYTNGTALANFGGAVNAVSGFEANGTAGVTVSGTTCTITAITGGIITAATCTP